MPSYHLILGQTLLFLPPIFQSIRATQGNRLSCRDQEGRRGSEEAVPGPSVFKNTLLLLLLSHFSRVQLCVTP